MSKPSVTPVATGTTGVFLSDPVVRFQQAIDLDLRVRDLERRVQRLARCLSPRPSASPADRRGRRRSASGWPGA